MPTVEREQKGVMSITAEEAQQVLQRAQLLYSREQIEAVLDRLAQNITTDLSLRNPLVLSVMVGGLVFAGQLVTRLHFPLQLDYVHATRYRGRTEGSELHWQHRPSRSLQGRVVLLIDDILDEGVTLAAIVEACRAEGALDVRTAVLVDKVHERKSGLKTATYTGVYVEDRYVFGYGMDYQGFLRNAAGIYAVPA